MVDPKINENFCFSGFQYGIALLPHLEIFEDIELRKKLATEKPIAKGYNFYISGHLQQFFFKKESVVH